MEAGQACEKGVRAHLLELVFALLQLEVLPDGRVFACEIGVLLKE